MDIDRRPARRNGVGDAGHRVSQESRGLMSQKLKSVINGLNGDPVLKGEFDENDKPQAVKDFEAENQIGQSG